MDMSRLQAFCTVVEAGSFTKAAKTLYVTQPSISVKIQELESFYQVKLLERNSKRVVPTESGSLLYEQGKKILLLAENIQKNIERLNNTNEGEILVGASCTIGNFALPCSVYLFKERFPRANITLSINNSATIVNNILNQSIKIGLIEGPVTKEVRDELLQEGIRVKRIINHELVLTAPKNDQWADIDEISVDELKSFPLIMREPGCGIRRTIEKTLMEQELPPDALNTVMQLDSTNAIISTISSDRGVSLLPRMAIRKELRYGILKKINIRETRFLHPFTLLYYPGETLQKYHNAFIDLVISKDRGFC